MGLPSYEAEVLVLDFQKQLAATLPKGVDVAAILGKQASSVSVDFDGHRIRVPMRWASGQETHALLDTGLSPFPVWTTEALWRTWTQLNPNDPQVRRYRFPTPRGDLVFASGVVRVALHLGERELGRVEAVFLEVGPQGAALESWPFDVKAVLGPALFAKYSIVGIDISNRRLVLGK